MPREMRVVYINERLPRTFSKSIFLAGPSARDTGAHDWRADALAELEDLGYDGVVYIPYPKPGTVWKPKTESDAWRWEHEAMGQSDVVAFWVPRSNMLPAFTTNIEWGEFYRSGKAVLGFPPTAPGMARMELMAKWTHLPIAKTLRNTMLFSMGIIGAGAPRKGGEISVPIAIWKSDSFQQWYAKQKKLGLRLDGTEILWAHPSEEPHQPPGTYALRARLWNESKRETTVAETVLTEQHSNDHVLLVPNEDDPGKSTVIIVSPATPVSKPRRKKAAALLLPTSDVGKADEYPSPGSGRRTLKPTMSLLQKVLSVDCTVATSKDLDRLSREMRSDGRALQKRRTTVNALIARRDPDEAVILSRVLGALSRQGVRLDQVPAARRTQRGRTVA